MLLRREQPPPFLVASRDLEGRTLRSVCGRIGSKSPGKSTANESGQTTSKKGTPFHGPSSIIQIYLQEHGNDSSQGGNHICVNEKRA